VLSVGLLGAAEALLELGNAATGVKNLLLARVERVTLVAHFSVNLTAGTGAVGRERVTAVAGNRRLDVIGMNIGLHN